MQFIQDFWPYLAALLPTVGVAFLFYWIIRYMIGADRSERKALAQWNAKNKAKTKNADRDNQVPGDSAGNFEKK